MKSVILLLSAMTAVSAFAVDINPTLVQPVCLQRVYTKEHVANNPKQKLSELTIKLQEKSYTDEYSKDTYTIKLAQLVARSTADGALYGNTAGCNFNADGSASCQIECDGGSFDLKQRPSWINFAVTPDYYFPFYKGVLEPDIENTEEFVSLDGNDPDNNLFRVEKVSVDKCDAAIAQILEKDGGC
jgi:hypothetical protein